jgi:hypothetical protein
MQDLNKLLGGFTPDILDTTNTVLSRLFRSLIYDLKLSREDWSRLMDSYVESLPDSQGMKDADRMAIRSNLARDLMSDEMTWDTFCKGLVLLRLDPFSLTISGIQRNTDKSSLVAVTTTHDLRLPKLNQSDT